MKRFITYLYEYEQEQKMKSTGFVRVDERDGIVSMQVSVRHLVRTHEKGKIYALVQKARLMGVLLGEVSVVSGQGDETLRLDANRMAGSPYGLEDVVGIGIEFRSRGYLASCWKDEAAAAIARGGFDIWEEHWPEEVYETEVDARAVKEARLVAAEAFEKEITYRKMSFDDIRQLPRQNWYLTNNRFLIHGFSNYGYLLLKTEPVETEEQSFLGVPGVFEKPEMVVAALFGFSEFEMLEEKVVEAQMDETVSVDGAKTKKDPMSGSFGAWFIPLQ